MTDIPIIYEDTDLLVINKPAGMIVNRATSHQQVSLQEQLTDYLHLPEVPDGPVPDEHASPNAVFAFRQGMVHRLDKDTSGVILWAKNPTSLISLLHQFQARAVHKTYTCLVHGLINEPEGRINLPLERSRKNRQLMTVSPAGRPAITHYQVTRVYPDFATARLLTAHPELTSDTRLQYRSKDFRRLYQGFSLLSVSPQTGRTHQIRAHLTYRGHPLVGDVPYLPRRKARLDPLWCPRQFLHAAQITFTHPTSGEELTFSAPLPPDLQEALTWMDT